MFDDELNSLIERVDRLVSFFPLLRMYPKLLWPLLVPNYKGFVNDRNIVRFDGCIAGHLASRAMLDTTRSTLSEVIVQKRAAIERGSVEDTNLLGMMIELGKQDLMTEGEIIDEAMMFYFVRRHIACLTDRR